MISHPKKTKQFEKQEMVKRMLVDYVPKPTKSAISKVFSKLKNTIQNLYRTSHGAENDVMENEAKKEN